MRHRWGLASFVVGTLWATLLVLLLAPMPAGRAEPLWVIAACIGGPVGGLVGWVLQRLRRALRGP